MAISDTDDDGEVSDDEQATLLGLKNVISVTSTDDAPRSSTASKSASTGDQAAALTLRLGVPGARAGRARATT